MRYFSSLLLALALLVPVAAHAEGPSAHEYEAPRVLHDTPGHELNERLTPEFSRGAKTFEELIVPGVQAAYEAELAQRLFSSLVIATLNTAVEVLPPDVSAPLLDEPVKVSRELLADRSIDPALAAVLSMHRDELIHAIIELTEGGGMLDLETRERLATPLVRDIFDLSADARVHKVLANVYDISRAELDFNPGTKSDVATTFFDIGDTLVAVTPEQYDQALDLIDSLYRQGVIEKFSAYAQANYPFASKQNPIIRLADQFECVFDPKGRRGIYRLARTIGILIANFEGLEDVAALSLDNLDRFTEPSGLQMFYNIFAYPRLPQLIEGFHIAVEMGKFDPVLERVARIAAGEPVELASKEPVNGEVPTAERDVLISKFEEYMKSGQRSRLVLFMTGQVLSLLGELGDVRLKSEPRRSMLNESIDFVTYLLVGDSARGIPPVADPLLDGLYDILLDDAKSERFLRVLQEGSRIFLNPPNGLSITDLDNQASDILKCDPELVAAAVLRDQLDDDPGNGDARPAVPILKMIAKADPGFVAVGIGRYGAIVERKLEDPFVVFLKRIYEAEKPDWYPIVSLSEEVFSPKRGGKSIFERSGRIAAHAIPQARGRLPKLQLLLGAKHRGDLLALYGTFQRVIESEEGKRISITERLSPTAVTLASASDPFTGKPVVDDLIIVLDAVHHSNLDMTVLDLLIVLEGKGFFDRSRDPNIYGTLEHIIDETLKTRAEQVKLFEKQGAARGAK